MESADKALVYAEFYIRENEEYHSSINSEMRFYDSVKRGEIEEVRRMYSPLGSKGYGVLSENEIRNLRYHLIITIAFVTRFCIEGGMESETAFSLSDIYIRQADKAITAEQINLLHKNVIEDFTDRMARLRKSRIYSKQIMRCYDYIYKNLNRSFTVADMAQELGLTAQYLSKLFHKETGETISRYIMRKRIETACRMLIYSNYEAGDIASFLAFSSHSHFIQCFKKETGLTPGQYRNLHYSDNKGMKGGADLS